jgi:hypothetical protein
MFEPSSTGFIDLKKCEILHVFQSLNQPVLSPEPGLPAELSQAYFVISENHQQKVSLAVGLCFLQSSHRILYEVAGFTAEEIPERLVQAEAFVGEMGFMMDDLHFQDSRPEEQKDILRTLPFVYRDQETFLQALSGAERASKNLVVGATSMKATGSQKYSFFLEHYVRMLSML